MFLGDLIVFSWDTYGHVAVIDTVSGSTISVVEQNANYKYVCAIQTQI